MTHLPQFSGRFLDDPQDLDVRDWCLCRKGDSQLQFLYLPLPAPPTVVANDFFNIHERIFRRAHWINEFMHDIPIWIRVQ